MDSNKPYKVLTGIKRERALQALIEEQRNDMSSQIMFPQHFKLHTNGVLVKLNNKEKAVLLLSIVGEMSCEEIGEVMGYTKQHIGRLIKAAKSKLRQTI